MIKNKQVNMWRGSEEPPTIYHVWIKDDLTIELYNGSEWVTFIDDISIGEQIVEIINNLQSLQEFMNTSTVNGHKIKNNPILDAMDLKSAKDGVYVNGNDSIANTLMIVDELLTTRIIE